MKTGKYPNTFYRVSVKAIIRNKKGEVLVVKEHGGPWSLPGGGIDHGETAEVALAREMYEELLVTESFTAMPKGIDQMFLESRDAYLLWVVYELSFDSLPVAQVGEDGDEAAYIDPRQFKDSVNRSERLVYRWCVDRAAAFE